MCDALDACNNVLNVEIVGAKQRLGNLATPPGDDTLSLSGTMVVATTLTIDPKSKGIRVIVSNADGDALVDAILPGGAHDAVFRVGWRCNSSGSSGRYDNKGTFIPLASGIYRVTLKRSTGLPGTLRFNVNGKRGGYGAGGNWSILPLDATIVIDSPQATGGQCGDEIFPVHGCTVKPNSLTCSKR